jgi:hypothetical protein
VVGAQELV